MTSFFLQTTWILYRNIAASYLWKVTDANNFAASLHKSSASCLVNLYDIWKGMLIKQAFDSIYPLIHSGPCILSSRYSNKMTSSADPTK